MNDKELEAAVLAVLADIAPETKTADLDPTVSIRDQIDFDSMDFLNMGMGLSKALNVEIRALDYPQIATVAGAVRYLRHRLANEDPDFPDNREQAGDFRSDPL